VQVSAANAGAAEIKAIQKIAAKTANPAPKRERFAPPPPHLFKQ